MLAGWAFDKLSPKWRGALFPVLMSLMVLGTAAMTLVSQPGCVGLYHVSKHRHKYVLMRSMRDGMLQARHDGLSAVPHWVWHAWAIHSPLWSLRPGNWWAGGCVSTPCACVSGGLSWPSTICLLRVRLCYHILTTTFVRTNTGAGLASATIDACGYIGAMLVMLVAAADVSLRGIFSLVSVLAVVTWLLGFLLWRVMRRLHQR